LAHWDKNHLASLDGEVIQLKTRKAKTRKKCNGKLTYGPEVVVSLKAIGEFF
jgi:hypothetical protein